jgi:molybdopterin-guanine dinucleotide biosynthesis protein A
MGTPKPLLLFDGVPLVSRIAAALQPLFAHVIIVASPGLQLPELKGPAIVRDEVPHRGPLAGLCYGMAAAREDVCFLTACDSPFVSADLIALLVSRIDGRDAVVPQWDGRVQPLHAVYHRRILPLLRGRIARGQLKATDLLNALDWGRVLEHEVARVDPAGAAFVNMNTPADYESALRSWRTLKRA